MAAHAKTPAHPGGFTLVELAVVLAVAGVLAVVAWPAFHESLMRGWRADGVAALTRLQLEQERFKAHHGTYAAELNNLGAAGSPHSTEGLYRIELQRQDADTFVALAVPRAGSRVDGDTSCPQLQLRVRDGIAAYQPSARCWNR